MSTMTPERQAQIEALAVADGQVLVGRALSEDEQWLILHTVRLMVTCMPDLVARIDALQGRTDPGADAGPRAEMGVVA